MMTEQELMKLSENSDEKIEFYDFTTQELEKILEDKKIIKPKINKTASNFKRTYFDYYDDVKDKSLRKQDW